MLRLCEGWRELLKPTGSIMLNLGVCWTPGMPAQSLYMERLLIRLEDDLGIHLLQRLDWHSPTKLPTPLQWVGIRRVRVKPSVEPLLWLSPDPQNAKADNRNVLRAYSESGLRSIQAAKERSGTRPSGITFGANSFVDRGYNLGRLSSLLRPAQSKNGVIVRLLRRRASSHILQSCRRLSLDSESSLPPIRTTLCTTRWQVPAPFQSKP